jgi:hypothetical protein
MTMNSVQNNNVYDHSSSVTTGLNIAAKSLALLLHIWHVQILAQSSAIMTEVFNGFLSLSRKMPG